MSQDQEQDKWVLLEFFSSYCLVSICALKYCFWVIKVVDSILAMQNCFEDVFNTAQ